MHVRICVRCYGITRKSALLSVTCGILREKVSMTSTKEGLRKKGLRESAQSHNILVASATTLLWALVKVPTLQ